MKPELLLLFDVILLIHLAVLSHMLHRSCPKIADASSNFRSDFNFLKTNVKSSDPLTRLSTFSSCLPAAACVHRATRRYKKVRKIKGCITLNLKLDDTNYISCGRGTNIFQALVNWHFYRLPGYQYLQKIEIMRLRLIFMVWAE